MIIFCHAELVSSSINVIPSEGMHRTVRLEVEGSSTVGRFLHAPRQWRGLVGMTIYYENAY
jgi:hypothetical protein